MNEMQRMLLSGMSNSNMPFTNQQTGEVLPEATEYIEEQQFDSQGRPIPISETMLATEAVPKFMDPVDAANDIGQQLLKEWQKGFADFFSSNNKGMLTPVTKKVEEKKQTTFTGHPSEIIKTQEPSRPGWMLPRDSEGNINGNYWSVNTEDPYWQTQEGYEEAMNLYGEKPAWVNKPTEEEEFVDLAVQSIAPNLKKYF
jgi:hypothetical protein